MRELSAYHAASSPHLRSPHHPPTFDLSRRHPSFGPSRQSTIPQAYDPARSVYDRAGWYKYDVYAAGLVWLCVAVPALAADSDLLQDLDHWITLDPTRHTRSPLDTHHVRTGSTLGTHWIHTGSSLDPTRSPLDPH